MKLRVENNVRPKSRPHGRQMIGAKGGMVFVGEITQYLFTDRPSVSNVECAIQGLQAGMLVPAATLWQKTSLCKTVFPTKL